MLFQSAQIRIRLNPLKSILTVSTVPVFNLKIHQPVTRIGQFLVDLLYLVTDRSLSVRTHHNAFARYFGVQILLQLFGQDSRELIARDLSGERCTFTTVIVPLANHGHLHFIPAP